MFEVTGLDGVKNQMNGKGVIIWYTQGMKISRKKSFMRV